MEQGPFSILPQHKRRFLLIQVAWLLLVAISAWINHFYSHQEMEQSALAEARAIYQRDTAYRAWVAGLGGVYAPVNAKTPPNPYLANRPDRDQSKRDGTPLTLINPAYMVRLVNEFQGKQVTHVTSLKPLRPENAPDPWEQVALERLEREHLPEVFEFTTLKGEPYLRYVRPSITEAGCLKCHADQGYRLGDIRGGLAISLPLAKTLAGHRKTSFYMLGLHLLIYLIGAALLLWGQAFLGRRVRERDLAVAALAESERNFRTVADFAYAWEYWLGADGKMRHVSPSVKELTGYGPEQFTADPDLLKKIVIEEDRENLLRHIAMEDLHEKAPLDFRIRTATGEVRWLHHVCRPVYGADGAFLGRRASNFDITEEKTAKLCNEELIAELYQTLEKVKLLSGFIPICAGCKKIRDDQGYWNQVEAYIASHSEAVFSHGLCPECAHHLYPEYFPDQHGAEEGGDTGEKIAGGQLPEATGPTKTKE